MPELPLKSLNTPRLFANAIRRARRLAGRTGRPESVDSCLTGGASNQIKRSREIESECDSKRKCVRGTSDIINPDRIYKSDTSFVSSGNESQRLLPQETTVTQQKNGSKFFQEFEAKIPSPPHFHYFSQIKTPCESALEHFRPPTHMSACDNLPTAPVAPSTSMQTYLLSSALFQGAILSPIMCRPSTMLATLPPSTASPFTQTPLRGLLLAALACARVPACPPWPSWPMAGLRSRA